MKKFIALFILATGFLISPALGQENCPKINIHGPMGIVPPGGTVTYRATVEPIDESWPLKYEWSISSGKIEAGQGTSTVLIRQGDTGLTVTVDISGLPGKCPSTFSETSIGDPAPSAVKVGIWKKGQAPTIHQQFAEELAQHPDNQGFVFISRGPTSTQSSFADLTAIIRNIAKNQVLDTSRVTIVEDEGFEELAEFWRVPPGAENPKCTYCKTLCPDLKIIVPDKTTPPGEIAEVSLSIDPAPTQPITVDWEVSAGTIEKGQGTGSIALRTSRDSAGQYVTAIAGLRSLPKGCNSKASGEFSVQPIQHGHVFDEYGRLPLADELGHIDNVAWMLSLHSDRTAYFILFRDPNESLRSEKVRERRIIDHLVKIRKIPRDRFVVLSGGTLIRSTRVHILSPGAEKPAY